MRRLRPTDRGCLGALDDRWQPSSPRCDRLPYLLRQLLARRSYAGAHRDRLAAAHRRRRKMMERVIRAAPADRCGDLIELASGAPAYSEHEGGMLLVRPALTRSAPPLARQRRLGLAPQGWPT